MHHPTAIIPNSSGRTENSSGDVISGVRVLTLGFIERPARGQHEALEGRMALESQRSETKPVVDLVERADLGGRGQVSP